ncbi:unnamed protein product [Amoebophrya sp. A120]|nr:unnamed protein product [Amoebophrya sp. A120]|eukprot:GSA120T00003217001.1
MAATFSTSKQVIIPEGRGRVRNFVGTDAGQVTLSSKHDLGRVEQDWSEFDQTRTLVKGAITQAVRDFQQNSAHESSGSVPVLVRQDDSLDSTAAAAGAGGGTNVKPGGPHAAVGRKPKTGEKFDPDASYSYSEKFYQPGKGGGSRSHNVSQELSRSSCSTQYVGQGSARRPHKAGPAPGQYQWKDEVHLTRPGQFSIVVPDRSKLDPNVAAWVSASTSETLKPPPGAYGDLSKIKPQGGAVKLRTVSLGASKAERTAPKAFSNDLMYRLPPLFGTWRHPTIHVAQGFSVQSCERKFLSAREDSWLPLQTSNQTPGPGEYANPRWLEGKKKSTLLGHFHNPKKGPAFGRRIDNLSTLRPSWIPDTFSVRHFRSIT